MGRPGGWLPLLPQLLDFTGRKKYISLILKLVAVILGVVVFLCLFYQDHIAWKTEFVHGQNSLLKPAFSWIWAVCPSTAEIPALPPPPA